MLKQLELDKVLSIWNWRRSSINGLKLCKDDITVHTNNIFAQAINSDETGQFKHGNAVSITR
jgi:hypothetical protein